MSFINLNDIYTGRVDTTDPNYPRGKPRNKQGDIDGTGTPYEELYFQDISGAFQALLAEGGITPSGNPDNATNSDIRDAILKMIRKPLVLKIFQSPTDGGLTEISTRTLDSGAVYEVRKVSDDSLATIYSDAAGTTEIVQNGTNNVSDSMGVVGFYIADGEYYVLVSTVMANFNVIKNGTFKTLTDVKSADFSGYAEYTRIDWQGRVTQSDSGSGWGVLRFGTHVADDFEIISINTDTYILVYILGSNDVAKAGIFEGTVNPSTLQNMIEKTNGSVNFGHDKTYTLSGGVDIVGDNKTINLNGSTLNFTTSTYSFYDKGDNNTIKSGTILTDYTLGSGGNGHAGSCITVGEQSTGDGRKGFKYKNLELTTNRTDAGAHISIIGGCHNFEVDDITFRDNAVCRNLVGIEWGGTPVLGTQHPHNGTVSNLKVGKITTPTYGSGGYAYVVWCSAAFNITIKNIECQEAYGLVMNTAGDNANTYAPAEYKKLVGSGVTLTNAGISACYGYAIRSIGKGSGSSDTIPCNIKAKGIIAVGKKVGVNNNFALQTEFSDGVHLDGFSFSGVWAGGTTTGSDAKNHIIENGEITGCELYGSSVGSGAIKSIKPTIRRVNYSNNNTLGGAGSSTSAVVISASDDAVVEFCNFGKEGDTEIQRYSVYTAATANRPKIMHNHTYVNDNPAVNPYLNGSATVYDENNTKDF